MSLQVIRDKVSGYPDVPAMLSQMEDWSAEEKFANQFWRLNNLYKIVDKNSKVVTFVMKPEQADLYVSITQHPRHVICKSRQLGFCLGPDTKVLTSDLRWVKISEIKVGEEIVAVDEFGIGKKSNGRDNARRMRTGIVEGVNITHQDAYKLIFDDGTSIICSRNHRWLSRYANGNSHNTNWDWRYLGAESWNGHSMIPSKGALREGYAIRKVCDVWEDGDFEDGWIGGMLDGEGSIALPTRTGSSVNISQRDNAAWRRVVDYVAKRGYNAHIESDFRKKGDNKGKLGNKVVHKMCFSRLNEMFRLIGQTRPSRFIGNRFWDNKELPGSRIGRLEKKIVKIEYLGEMDLYDLQTSTKTFIADGLVSHNSTFIQIFYLDCAIFNSNENVFIIAQDKDAASAIMETKIKFAYNNLPTEIKEIRKVVKSNSDEFLLNNNSKITVTVSARSATATRIHSSEMAKSYIKDPEKTHEFWTGTLPALIPGGTCCIESTAEGSSGDFYEAYMNKAMDNPQDQNTFMRHFYSWWRSPEFTSDTAPEGGFDSDLRKYFLELKEKHGIDLTARQKNWYAAMSRVLGFKMKQEYPTVDTEAFEQTNESQVWGRPLALMRANGRVRNTPYLRNYPAVVAFDIGHSDLAACWCAQWVEDEPRIFAYLEIRKGDISWFLEKFAAKGFTFKLVLLPHDAAHGSFKDGDRSLAAEVENWGYNVYVVPKTKDKLKDVYETGKFIPECRFNADPESGVPDGIKRLENYRKKKSPDGGYLMDPNHDSNGNCDAADAFRYLATTFEMIKDELYEDDMNKYLDDVYGPDNYDVGPTGY